MKTNANGEQVFPVYKMNFEWSDDSNAKNSISNFLMFKDEQSDLEAFAAKEWEGFNERRKLGGKNQNSKLISAKAEFVEFETWCLDWFNHYTFDFGQSNEDVMRSFAQFVWRHEDHSESRSLMGAEDRWRWHGETQDDPAPCRCEGCTKYGVIRVNH